MLSAYTPEDFLYPYLIYDTFDWCQIRQAFAEELYDAFYSTDGKFGVESWYDAFQEADSVKIALESNYNKQPMFIGARIGEVDWPSLWCLAWWYARQNSAQRQELRTDFANRQGPLLIRYEESGSGGAYCFDKNFYREQRHMQPADCAPIPRGIGEKILAFAGGLGIGIAVLGGFTLLIKSKKKRR